MSTDFLKAIGRMFTIPRKQREAIARVPGAHALAATITSLAAATAVSVVDQHVADPETAERLKAAIEHEVHALVPPLPVPAGGLPLGGMVDHIITDVTARIVPTADGSLGHAGVIAEQLEGHPPGEQQ